MGTCSSRRSMLECTGTTLKDALEMLRFTNEEELIQPVHLLAIVKSLMLSRRAEMNVSLVGIKKHQRKCHTPSPSASPLLGNSCLRYRSWPITKTSTLRVVSIQRNIHNWSVVHPYSKCNESTERSLSWSMVLSLASDPCKVPNGAKVVFTTGQAKQVQWNNTLQHMGRWSPSFNSK